MTVYEFITKYVNDENEIHFFDRNAKPIGMIPSSQLVDKWIDNPIICEDTWKVKPMPEHSISKILNAEFACISSGGSRFSWLAIYVDIDASDILKEKEKICFH